MKYPLIVFARGGKYFDVLTNSQERLVSLERATSALLKSGYFNRPFSVVDYEGKTYSLREVKVVGHIGPFGGFNIFLNRKLKIKCHFDEVAPIGLEELKRRVVGELRKDGGHLWSGGSTRNDLNRKINEATSVSSIIDALK